MFCKGPFVSQLQRVDGSVSMCSADMSTNGDKIYSLEEEWNSESRKQARIAYMAGNIPERCRPCMERRISGVSVYSSLSRVFDLNSMMSQEELIAMCDPDGSMAVTPSYLHVAPSNECQLACRMCNAESSSSYCAINEVEPKNTSDIASTFEYIMKCAPKLENFIFDGGEPTKSKYFDEIMEELIKYGDKIKFKILSNGMSLTGTYGTDIIDMFNRLPNCQYALSLDGHREITEYQRVFSNFDTIIENMKRINEEAPHVTLTVVHTVTNVSLLFIPEFYDMMMQELQFVKGISHNLVTSPSIYSVSNVPYDMRKDIITRLKSIDTIEMKPSFDVALKDCINQVSENFIGTMFSRHDMDEFFVVEDRLNAKLNNPLNIIAIFSSRGKDQIPNVL